MANNRIVSVGECMLELAHPAQNDQVWRLNSGGDTYNCLVYLSRLGYNVGYLTALGKDRFSDRMRAEWENERVGLDMVLTHPTRHPGVYAISLDAHNERSFTYWRGESAARLMFDCPGAQVAIDEASRASYLYITGVTLSILDHAGRERVAEIARRVRASGGEVAFDLNYRARGWPDQRAARAAIDSFARHVSIAMPSIEDQQAVYNDSTAEDAIRRWRMFGASEVIIKRGAQGATVSHNEEITEVPLEREVAPRDTTGAGDAFNAAYLAARIAGKSMVESAQMGNRLASTVVQQPGAVIPKVMMPIGLTKGTAQQY